MINLFRTSHDSTQKLESSLCAEKSIEKYQFEISIVHKADRVKHYSSSSIFTIIHHYKLCCYILKYFYHLILILIIILWVWKRLFINQNVKSLLSSLRYFNNSLNSVSSGPNLLFHILSILRAVCTCAKTSIYYAISKMIFDLNTLIILLIINYLLLTFKIN